MFERTRVIPALALCGLLLLGCSVGPDFIPPQRPGVSAYTSGELPPETASAQTLDGPSQRFARGAQIPAQWWKLFQSDDLDRLIRMALTDNPTAAAAQAALRQSRENLIAQTGASNYPTIDANVSASRQRISGESSGFPAGGGTIFNLYNASVGVSYRFDLFGGNRRELEALQAQVDYQGYQLQGTYLALTANIVTAAVREASLRAELQASRDIIAEEQQAYELARRRFQLGSISRADVLAQLTRLAQTQATLPPLEKALSQTRHQIAVLVGKFPGEAGALPEFEIQGFTLPVELPVSLPSRLTRQRPDIQAAEALLHAASARVGVATANLYPRITLTGQYGSQATASGDLFQSNTSIWSLGAGLLQPLFHGGQLKAQRRASVFAYDQAAAQYRETVLQAFLNVADTLRALEADARYLAAQAKVETSARDTLELTTKQFQFGAVSFLSLLDAQRQYHQARISLIQAQAARLADTAALFQALGGGWWDSDPGAAARGN